MKSIIQNCQLSDKILKGILNNDENVVNSIKKGVIEESEFPRFLDNFAERLSDQLRVCFQRIIEKNISAEFFDRLEEAATEGKDTSRNGYYERKIRTSLGDFLIQIPRARFLSFTTKLLNKYGHNLGKIEDYILSLYRSGNTENDIVNILSQTEGIGLSASTIQKIIKTTIGESLKFNQEQVEDCPFVYLDATYIPFKRSIGLDKSVEKEGILVALGITPSGYIKILGYVFGETEKIDLWKELLRNLKERGLKNPKMFITDGLSGRPEAIREIYPHALHQRCIVHYQRNLKSHVRKSDWENIGDDFQKVYRSKTKEEALEKFELFSSFWGTKYKGLKQRIEKTNDNIFSYYSFPEEIRRSLYTSNAIEGFNSKLKRETRKRILMNSEDNASIVITAVCRSYNSSKLGRRRNGLLKVPQEVREELGFDIQLRQRSVSSCPWTRRKEIRYYITDFTYNNLHKLLANIILYYWNQSKLNEYCYKFDIFNKDLSCIVYIPKTFIDKELYNEYLFLGPDFLLGAKGITDSVLFQCVLPAFYFNLVKEDLTTHEEYTKLQNYQIGLH